MIVYMQNLHFSIQKMQMTAFPEEAIAKIVCKKAFIATF